jgi:hypothetical protein
MNYMLAMEIAELFLGFLIKPSNLIIHLSKSNLIFNLTASAFGFCNLVLTKLPVKYGSVVSRKNQLVQI